MKNRNIKNLIKIVALVLAAAFCLQVASVMFAMENKPVPPMKPTHITQVGNFICISQDRSKIELWNGTTGLKTKEFAIPNLIANDDAIAINNAGTKIAAVSGARAQVFDTATGQCQEKFELPQGFQRLSFSVNPSGNNQDMLDLHWKTENTPNNRKHGVVCQGLGVKQANNAQQDTSLINKILAHKMTKVLGICALGAGFVSLVGWGIYKLVKKAKESKPQKPEQPIRVRRQIGG